MRILLALVAPITLAACGGGSVTPPVEGPLNLDIVAGQDQIARAGTPQLSDPVVGQLVRVRTADGRWRFKFEIVKTAYAQTTVKGSPVVGAVVCSKTVAGNFEPFSVCTNTDSAGKATFYYETGTKAGAQRAEVRGLNAQGQPAVFDTVRATVEPGPADVNRIFNGMNPNQRSNPTLACCSGVGGTESFTVADSAVADVYVNLLPFRIEGDSLISVSDTTFGSVGARTIDYLRWWERNMTAAETNAYDRTGVLRVLGKGDVPVATLRYEIRDGNGFAWVVKGLNVTP